MRGARIHDCSSADTADINAECRGVGASGPYATNIKTYHYDDRDLQAQNIRLEVLNGLAYHAGDTTILANAVVYDSNTNVGKFDVVYNAAIVNIKRGEYPYGGFARVPVPINADFSTMKVIVFELAYLNLNVYHVVREDKELDYEASLGFTYGEEYFFTCYSPAEGNNLVEDPFAEYLVDEQ